MDQQQPNHPDNLENIQIWVTNPEHAGARINAPPTADSETSCQKRIRKTIVYVLLVLSSLMLVAGGLSFVMGPTGQIGQPNGQMILANQSAVTEVTTEYATPVEPTTEKPEHVNKLNPERIPWSTVLLSAVNLAAMAALSSYVALTMVWFGRNRPNRASQDIELVGNYLQSGPQPPPSTSPMEPPDLPHETEEEEGDEYSPTNDMILVIVFGVLMVIALFLIAVFAH